MRKVIKQLKVGDSLADVHYGVPSLEIEGLLAHPNIAPVPVSVARALFDKLLPDNNGYFNKSLIVVNNDDPIITAIYMWDGYRAAIVSFDLSTAEWIKEEA